MKFIKVKIEGTHCASCAKLISINLEDLVGIQSVKVDSSDKTGEIIFDETIINTKKILQTIINSGYKATIYE